MFQDYPEGKRFVSYTRYLKDKKSKELAQIHKIKSLNERKKKNNSELTQMVEKKNEKNHQADSPKLPNKEKESIEKQNWIKVDQKASIVNGKLVYMEDQIPSLEDTDQLINLLRQNKIKIKQYIYGNKSEIFKEIKQNYENFKDQEVQKYINKNMKQENAVQAKFSAWYEENKENLFK